MKRLTLSQLNRPKWLKWLLLIALLCGCIGLAAILMTHALTPATGVEPENGTVNSPAAVTKDPGASGGKSVQFSPPSQPPVDVKAVLAANTPGSTGEAIPNGLPTTFDWRTNSTLRYIYPATPPPDGATYATMKGQVYVDAANPVRPANTRVEIMNCQLYGLQVSSNSWQKLMDLSPGNLTGRGWLESFHNPGPLQYTNKLTEPDGGMSVITYPGYNFHFYKGSTNNPYAVLTGATYNAYVTGCSSRLVLANPLVDPTKKDDRASSGYIISQSADWVDDKLGNCGNSPKTGSKLCYGIGESRFIKVTTNWRRSIFSTLFASDLATKPLPPASLFQNPDGSYTD